MEKIDYELVVRFLLGDLPEESRSKLEERFFQDDRFYEELLAIQEELADDYVQDRLSPEDRARFENFFLQSPRRRERVEFAAAFSRAVSGDDTRGPTKLPRWQSRMVLSAAAAVLLVVAVWLAVESRRPPDRVQQARTETDIAITATGADAAQVERSADDPDGDEKASAAPDAESGGEAPQRAPETGTVQGGRAPSRLPSLPAEVAILVLSPNLTRGDSDEETVAIPSTSQPVRIQLDMEREEPYASFMAEVRTAQGRLVLSEIGLPMQRTSYGWAVLLAMPEGLTGSGEYEVELKGIAGGGSVEPVGYYYFTVLAR